MLRIIRRNSVEALLRSARGAVGGAVDELLGNALAYARTAISINAYRDGSSVRIDVADDGPGIAEGDHSRIFDRFVRAASAVPGGSGLGLALVRESAEAVGGAAWAEEGDGGGLRICTRWPVPTLGEAPDPTRR